MQEVQEISRSFEATSANDHFILKYGHLYGLIDLNIVLKMTARRGLIFLINFSLKILVILKYIMSRL